MSEIWNFTPELVPQVRICLAAALKYNNNNKWSKQFGHLKLSKISSDEPEVKKHKENERKIEKNDSPVLISDEEEQNQHILSENQVKLIKEPNESTETLHEILKSDITSKVDLIVNKSLKNHKLLRELATKLPIASIEKLCRHFFENKYDKDFLNIFFKHFMANLVKREYNRSTLDLILLSSKSYPKDFEILLSCIVKDMDISNKVLQDYVSSLNASKKTALLNTLPNFDLTKEEFSHHTFSIFTIYKDCIKNEQTQSVIKSLLNDNYVSCSLDRNFGRLLLTYLQYLKNSKDCTEYSHLDKMIESHRSPFQRPCLNLLKELKDSRDKFKSHRPQTDGSDSDLE